MTVVVDEGAAEPIQDEAAVLTPESVFSPLMQQPTNKHSQS